MRKTALVLLFLTLAIFSDAATVYGQNNPASFTPTSIDVKFTVGQETFVADEMVTLEGVVIFDQALMVHWDELSPERLNLNPFQVLKVVIGPQKPYSQGGNFFADYRMVQILIAPPSAARNGALKIPSFIVNYSYKGEKGIVKKQFTAGPWTVTKAPIKMSVSFLPDVLHLGERAELIVKIQRDKNVKVLNQFLGLLKDDRAGESEKTEIKRWAALLEARKESAFNLLAPDLKPFNVIEKSVTEVDRPNSVVSVYIYKVAYYGAVRPLMALPPVKLWYVSRKTNGEYQDPKVIASPGIKLRIASRLISKDRRLDGPQALSLKEFNLKERYLFGYAPMIIGALLFVVGLVFMFKRSERKVGKKVASAKPICFRHASKALIRYLKTIPRQSDDGSLGRLGIQPISEIRTLVFRVVGAVLALTRVEADAKTADEMVNILNNEFPEVDTKPVSRLINFLDKALVMADVETNGIKVPEELLNDAMPSLTRKNYWRGINWLIYST
ncbi:MAG: hypothetical protein Q7R61_00360 [bacterium]|nr:hypothetical protein [bacterium]